MILVFNWEAYGCFAKKERQITPNQIGHHLTFVLADNHYTVYTYIIQYTYTVYNTLYALNALEPQNKKNDRHFARLIINLMFRVRSEVMIQSHFNGGKHKQQIQAFK